MGGHASWATLATTTLQNFGKEIFDAVTTNTALLWMLKKADNIKVVSGGRQFLHPVIHQKNPSFQMYDKMAAISTDLTDGVTYTVYDIKVAAGSIALSTIDMAMNAGSKEQLLDYADVKRREAELSMSELLGTQVWADMSPSTEFGGLAYLITSTSSTDTHAPGGISSANAGGTGGWWNNQTQASLGTGFNSSSTGITAMAKMMNDCTFGKQGPTAIFTTKSIYGLYEVGLVANQRYTNSELADAGFKNLMYATVPVLFDDNCPTYYMYFIDTNSLWLQVLAQANNKITQFQLKDDQLAQSALMYLAGNITCGSRRTQGLLKIAN